MSHASTLTLYYRAGCGLCDEMQAELLAERPQYGFELELIDVDGSEPLVEAYGHKVPVLTTAEGEELCHYFLDHAALASYFSRA